MGDALRVSEEALETAVTEQTDAAFVAINYITCQPDQHERFQELFRTRAHAIDELEGFISMMVLQPHADGEPYLIVSFWRDEKYFLAWKGSDAFKRGHERGFEDVRKARAEGREDPFTSVFKTYSVLAR